MKLYDQYVQKRKYRDWLHDKTKMIQKQQRIIYLYETQDRKCFYCKRPFYEQFTKDKGTTVLNYNIDHKLPVSRGGKDNIENVVLSCVECNTIKGNLTDEEFMILRERAKLGIITQKDFPDYVKYLVLKAKFETPIITPPPTVFPQVVPLDTGQG